MPKCYSQQEREYIIRKLKDESKKCIAQYGIKKTTVDEIVKRARIPKGTFYLFYPTKELLLFEAILEVHEEVEEKILNSFSTIDLQNASVDELSDLLFRLYQLVDEIPILKTLAHEDMEILARKLPPEVIANHLNDDHTMLDQMFASLSKKKTIYNEAFSTAFRNIFLLVIEREDFNDPHFDSSIKLLLRGLVMQLLN